MAGSPLCPPLRGDRDCASVRITKAMQSGALLVVLLWPMVCQGISPPPPPRQWFTACGGKVNGSQGFIQTPHFPGPFPVPLSCRWVIEAPADKGIALYFTQFYLREGLRATEYVDFESDSTFWGKRDFGVLSFDNRTTYLITYKPFLVLDLHVTDMSNINMRVVDFFLDVYGFNITYEIISKGGGGSEVRRDACSVFKCSFTGDCIATYNFRKYYCQCFPGFYGDDCQFGPRCDPDRKVNLCKNGRSCRYYIGSQVYACDCPPGFEGDKCESTACRNLSCSQQCIQRPNRSYQCGCYSGYKLDKDNKTCLPSGRIRYLVSIKLKEPTFDPSASNRSSPQYLQLKHKIESELTNFLKKRLGEIKNLTVLELQQDGQVKFHFFANLADSETARRLFLESMKRKKIAGIAIDEDHIQFEKEPALSLQSVYVKEGRALVAGKGMTLACIAVGTSSMEFLFFKDGVLVDVHKSHRHMWQTIIPKNSRDQYTAVLNIERVQPQDKGTYTCQVSDWGEAQRKSVSFHVITPPTINVTPVTATLNMYESLTITCQSHEDSDGSFGYNWAKNEHILNPSDGKEIVEDLFPTGSRVKIISATDSAVYTCIVSNNAGQTTQNSHVTVINPKNVHTCPEQESYNVSWSRTSPNSEDIHPCPMGFRGMAKRSCSMIVTGPMWEEADFSDCVSQELANIFKNFESLKLGFLATNVTRVLRDVLFLLQPRYNTLYPGEGKAVLDLMADVLKYEERYPPANSVVKLQHAELFLDIISLLLSSPKALNTPEKAMKLHREVLRETHVLASLVEVGKTTTARREPLVIEATRVPAQGRHSLHFPSKVASRSPDWLTDYLVTTVETSALMGQTLARENSTLEIAVVFYKNISRFLPRRYLAKFEHGLDVEYVVDSRVVALSVQKDKQEIGISPGSAQISVTFDHHDKHINKSGWNVTCGLANFSHGKPQWHLSGCSLSSADNFTQCFCDRFGTYAILLTTYIIPEEEELEVTFDLLIAICCIVCLGFLILTMLILMVCWRRIQGGFLILKLQLCLGLFGAVATFLGAARTSLNPESFPYMMTALEFFLLLPFSTQVCLELMLYLDMARTYRVKNARTKIIMIGWGIPLLVTGTTYAAQSLKGTPFTTWWITVDDIFFYGFVITSVILTILYLSLYLIISSELRHIRTVEVTKTKLTYPSGRLLQRTLVIQLFLTSLTVASISHVSSDSDAARYFFSASTGAMGFVVFLLYALNSDVPLCPCCQNGSKKENGASETPSRSESFRTFIKPDSTEECLSENNVVEYIERRKRAERLKRAQNNGTDTGPREAEDLLLHDVASKQNEHNSVRDDGGDNYMSGSCSKAALLEMVDLSGGGGNMNGKPPLPLRGKGDGLSRGLVLAEGTANNVDIIRYEGSPKKYPCVCGGGSSSIEYEGGTASTTCDYDDEDVDDRRGLIKPQRGTCYIRETPQSFPSRVDDPAASHAPAVMSSVPTVTSPKESGGPHVTFGPVFRVPFDAEDEEEEEVDEEEDDEEEGEEEEEEMDAKFSPKSLPLPPLHFQDNLPPPPSHSPPQVPALPPKLKPKHLPMDGIVHPFVLTRPRNPQESGSARTTDYPGDTVV